MNTRRIRSGLKQARVAALLQWAASLSVATRYDLLAGDEPPQVVLRHPTTSRHRTRRVLLDMQKKTSIA